MRRLLSAMFLALVLAFALAGCGGSDTTATTGDKAGASASASESATEAADPPAVADGNPDGKDLCAYLEKLEPKLEEVGPVGASAQLAMGLAGWVGKHPDQAPADSLEMDATTKKSCPDVRNAVLRDLDTKTLQEALG